LRRNVLAMDTNAHASNVIVSGVSFGSLRVMFCGY